MMLTQSPKLTDYLIDVSTSTPAVIQRQCQSTHCLNTCPNYIYFADKNITMTELSAVIQENHIAPK